MSKELKVGMVSLGCAKNLVDAEVMMGSLGEAGMAITADAAEADVLIVNTCSFVDDAKAESIGTIEELIEERRKHGRIRQKIIVAGCLAQRYAERLPEQMPEVDAYIGLDQVEGVAGIIQELMENDDAKGVSYVSAASKYIPSHETPRLRLTDAHSAYVKIAEGCNHPCSFCVIPKIRGRHRSRAQADIVCEVASLVEQGCKEVNLISQDTTYYGMDKWEGKSATPRSGVDSSRGESLTSLLRALEAIEGDFWIRLLYTHPAHWSTELMETIAASNKVVPYVDIPLQHISDNMLSAMQRETDGAYIRNLIREMREKIPGLGIRTAFIVGFPGETEDDFQELVEFCEEFRFERVGVFEYSREEDTRAYDIEEGMVDEETRHARWDTLMRRLSELAVENNETRMGEKLRVLVDAPGVARSAWDAPEIDCNVFVDEELPLGEFVEVEIVDVEGYDLVGE
ncbi:MAG: 30S ribosomal protein S12 methylthiotransferase RimO [Pontiellaceae bacterium]|nr:30S ribosomal protein S12 methylthiotransferase RimO [Pontiellaceae bacterium]